MIRIEIEVYQSHEGWHWIALLNGAWTGSGETCFTNKSSALADAQRNIATVAGVTK